MTGKPIGLFRRSCDFAAGLPSFLREMRDFPRRARYTLASRGFEALLSDIGDELRKRFRRGSLAMGPPPLPGEDATQIPLAARFDSLLRPHLELPLADDPRFSIVIPAFNEFARTYACVASILERTDDVAFEVIIVDDGSQDETRELESKISGVRVVRNEVNAGFIDACNRGAEAARGEFVVFLNNDTFVSQDWLAPLLGAFGPPDVGMVGAKLVYPDGRLQEAGGIIFSDASGWNYGRGDDPSNPKYEFLCDAHYCSGACIAIRRSLFEELGGFDSYFAPMYYEDVDLAFAVRAAGHRVVYQPACVIVHAEGGTSGTDTGSGSKRYQAINQKKFAEKWSHALLEQPRENSNPDIARYRGTGPHILIIDSYTPRPDHDAGSVRMLNIMLILRRLGCRVSFMPENRAQFGEYTRALQAAGIEALYHPFLPTMEKHLEEMGSRYHTVIASRVDVARQMIDAVRRHAPQAQLIFDTVDLHFMREARRYELTGQSEEPGSKDQELDVARACDLTWVVSPVEKEVLAREVPDVAVEVLSLITEPDPTDTPFSERNGIVFIANFQHPPNVDALEHYLLEVHPEVCERLPGVDLTVIGAQVSGSLQRLADSRVFFAGYVPDIRPAFARARISVAPLRYGAGIKGKINTSLAYRVPVVTTTVGAEGMNLGHDEQLLIADHPAAFAEAVVALYNDEAQWERLAENGFQSVTSQFSFAHAERSLRRILDWTGQG